MNYWGDGVKGAKAKLVSLGVDGFVVVCLGGRERRVKVWREKCVRVRARARARARSRVRVVVRACFARERVRACGCACLRFLYVSGTMRNGPSTGAAETLRFLVNRGEGGRPARVWATNLA